MAQTQTSPWAGVPYNPNVTMADVAPRPDGPPVFAPMTSMGGETPSMPQPAMPNVIQKPKMDLHANLPPVFAPTPKPNPQDEMIGHLQGKLEKDYEKDANPWGSPNNHPGFLGKLVHGFSVATGGDTRRGWEEQGIAKQLNDVVGQKSQNDFRGSETAKNTEETAEMPQKASDTHTLSGAQTENLHSEATDRDAAAASPPLATAYAHAVNQAIKEGRDPSQDPIVRHISDAIVRLQPKQNLPAEAPKTTDIKMPNGKVHTMGWNAKTGKYDVDEGESGFKPQNVNVNAGAGREFQEQERGRGLLDKAEAAYRTAQQGANTMRDMVASAQGGNKMSAQVLPLEGALAITTAQGVHRINRTEVDQYAGAGSLYDKIAGEVGKITQGQPIPPNILHDIQKLTDIQERGAYGTYKGAYDSATRRYGLKDEQALPEPGGGSQSQHKAGDKVMLGGKQVTIKKINPDGTFEY